MLYIYICVIRVRVNSHLPYITDVRLGNELNWLAHFRQGNLSMTNYEGRFKDIKAYSIIEIKNKIITELSHLYAPVLQLS